MQKRLTILPILGILISTLTLSSICLEVKAFPRGVKKKESSRPVLNQPIYYLRNSYHYQVDQAQEEMDQRDGAVDTFLYYFDDKKDNEGLKEVIFWDIDDEQIYIENSDKDNREKIIELSNLGTLAKLYADKIKQNAITPDNYDVYFDTYKGILEAESKGQLEKYVNANKSAEMAELSFMMNDSAQATKDLMAWYSVKYPKLAMDILTKNWDKPYTDTMISILGPKFRSRFLAYSRAGGKSSVAISRNQNPEVKVLHKIATQSQSTNIYKNYLFYDQIAAGRMTIAQADAITNNKEDYFSNLVKYRLDNPYLSNTKSILEEIKVQALQRYVRKINELHEKPFNVRFASISGLTPEELYYVAISGADEIYTSSYLGLYKIMMEKWGDTPTSALLDTVHHDKFRTFIRMASGYNEIDNFMSKMPEEQQDQLIVDFVSNLEKSVDEYGLEDAVDVADSYGSLKDEKVQEAMTKEIQKEYNRTRKSQDTRGMAIYSILLNVIEGKTKLNNGENVLELPPVLDMPIKNLEDENGNIAAVMFFYGDEDGRGSFNTYSNRLQASGFSRSKKKYWTEFKSNKNPNFTIYINEPLPEPDDEKAQKEMMNYLHQNGIHPSILVHRGHSYHVPLSIDQMEPSNKIVVLGSCGGYHNLKSILDNTKDQAQIVSSKQTGVGVVNNRILDELFATIAKGDNVEWIPLWDDIRATLKSSPAHLEYFEDYIPPFQNLGAIFMVSYKKLLGSTDLDGAE